MTAPAAPSPLAARFAALRSSGRRALMPFLTFGYPDEAVFARLLAEAERAGADVIEIGAPFSDPLADGPAIQHSSARALAGGVTLERILEALERRRGAGNAAGDAIPLVLMTYVNPLLGLGWNAFARRARAAGLAGVIVPDLPMEEGADLEAALAAEGVDLVYLAAPTTDDERLRELGRRSHGFLYLVSVTGVTGARDTLPEEFTRFVERARRATDLPLCLGFGIKNETLAREAARHVDGVIVGSALVDAIRAAGEGERAPEAVRDLLASLRRGVDAA